MKKEEFYYDSFCNTNRIHAIKWVPEGTPLCIVQIVHGMAEHVGRYEEFAQFLTDRNIMVVGEDHLGHGLSMGEKPAGYFCEKEPGKTLVENVRILKNIIRQEYPDVPYVLFGHSMGSFITRNYIHTYSEEVDGVILSGTGMLSKFLVYAMGIVVNVLISVYGEYHVSGLMQKLAFGSYLNRVSNPQTQSDWITTDKERLQEFLDDPLCGFTLTLNGFKGLKELITGLHDRDKAADMKKDLPMYFIFGDEDPVGDYGKSAYQSCRFYKELGMKNVSNRVYPGKRHELLNEDIRNEVMQDVFEWIRKEIR